MSNPWIIIIAGILFSLSGVYLFNRNAFEKNKKIIIPIIIILAGIILMSIGFARHFNLKG